MRGKFIAVYGINNIGKSTQTSLLVQRLLSSGVRTEYVKYPIYNLDPTGKMLNEILRGKKQNAVQSMIDFFPGTKVRRPSPRGENKIFRYQPLEPKSRAPRQKVTEEELQMWYSLNRYQFDPTVRRKLDAGVTIVAEDYIGTGLAWGAAKGANIEWLESVNKFLTPPDIEILMDGERFTKVIDGKKVVAGQEKAHLHESSDRLIKKARESFQALGKKNKWEIVDANQSIQNVADEIWQLVRPLVARRRSEPVDLRPNFGEI